MRLALLLAFTSLAITAVACSSAPAEDEGEEGAAAASAPTQFNLKGGVERIAQKNIRSTKVVDWQQGSVSKENLYWLARLSDAVYRTPSEVKAELQRMGLKTDENHLRFFENKKSHTQALYVTTASLAESPANIDNPYRTASPDVGILVFRGTEVSSPTDIGRDMRVWKRPGTSPIGNVHEGFASGVESVWNDNIDGFEQTNAPSAERREGIRTFLAKHHTFDGSTNKRAGAELYVTGHSLGGALATVAVAKTVTDTCEKVGKPLSDPCFLKYVPVSALVTFGSPRVADRSFANTLARDLQERTPIFRVVHGKDAVTKVPKGGFFHIGYDQNETDFRVHIVGGSTPTMRVAEGSDDEGDGSAFGDHSMTKYVPLLESLAFNVSAN